MGVLNLIAGPVLSLIGRFLPDPAAKAAAQQKFLEMLQQGQLADLDAQLKQNLAAAGVVQAEVASKFWLAANWRPILMMVFGGLIVARMFGLTAPNISPAEYLELWGLMKLGIGGYIGGRTVEKITPALLTAFKKGSSS